MSELATSSSAPSPGDGKKRTILGMNPFKIVFAMEYVLQGLANPFQGITYQPFFKHFRFDYGLDEAVTQQYFSWSYLAWSFKPIIGFLMDAYGKTKVVLIFLLSSAFLFYMLTPLVDVSAVTFFWYMFVLSMFLAATDVAVDRSTVVEGDAESKSSGKSKSTTVGLNQAICWAAIYGTSILASASGGYIADNIPFNFLMYALAFVPLLVLISVLFLPKDNATLIPVKTSIINFWIGLNTGPILWVIVFYFLFHFQPAMGALWNNYLIETLGFSQTQIGFSDSAGNFGYLIGVLLFAWVGVRWQDKIGLKRIFQIFIILSVLVNLTQYVMIDPWFTKITDVLAILLPFLPHETVRLLFLSTYNVFLYTFSGFTRMSTFSLVGAIIPSNAAGSLFAGFMSVANLAYSYSYSTGAWLYTNGLNFGIIRSVQEKVFGIPAAAGSEMAISMLLLIGSMAYLLSFLAAHMLPDRRETAATGDIMEYMVGPDHYKRLGDGILRPINTATMLVMFGMFLFIYAGGDFTFYQTLLLDPMSLGVANLISGFIKGVLLSFFCGAFLRKVVLDILYNRLNPPASGTKI